MRQNLRYSRNNITKRIREAVTRASPTNANGSKEYQTWAQAQLINCTYECENGDGVSRHHERTSRG